MSATIVNAEHRLRTLPIPVKLHQARGNRWHGPADRSAMIALYEEMKLLRGYSEKLAEAEHDPFDRVR